MINRCGKIGVRLNNSTIRKTSISLIIFYKPNVTYGHSTQRAIPIPPPIQRVATPRLDEVLLRACSRVTRMRAPDAPNG